MSKTRKAFGFYPEPLRIDAGPICVEPLPQLDEVAGRVLSGDEVESGWIYAPAHGVRDVMSGQVRERPYSARVFGLPQTHTIEHAGAEGRVGFSISSIFHAVRDFPRKGSPLCVR